MLLCQDVDTADLCLPRMISEVKEMLLCQDVDTADLCLPRMIFDILLMFARIYT